MGAMLLLSLDPALCSNAWKNTEGAHDDQEDPAAALVHEHIRVYNPHLSPSTPSKALLVTPATLVKMKCRCPKQLYHSKDGQDHLFVQHTFPVLEETGEKGGHNPTLTGLMGQQRT